MILTTVAKYGVNGNTYLLVHCGEHKAQRITWDMGLSTDQNHELAALQVARKLRPGARIGNVRSYLLPKGNNHSHVVFVEARE